MVKTHIRRKPYELAEKFLRSTRYQCATPKQAFGRCYDVSYHLLEYLHKRGTRARLLRGARFRKKLGDGAVSRWKLTPPGDMVHHVVLVDDDTVIDLTGSQFGYEYGDITYPLDVFKERWKFVVAYPDPCKECGLREFAEYHMEDAEYLQGNPEEDVF